MTTTARELKGLTNLIAVDRRLSRPLYQQIYDSFRERVLRGDLAAGQIVPSTRELARELRVSRLPVLDAYAQLVAEGYFETRVGAGTFIAGTLPGRSESAPRQEAGEPGLRPISRLASALGRYERPTWAETLGPFQIGQPDLASFPTATWSKLVARQSRRIRVKDLQYGDLRGLDQLREAVAHYLRTARAVHCTAENIMIVSGSQQALDLATRVLLDAGSPAWVEDPGYWLVRNVLTASGCRLVPVPVDAEGLNVASGIRLNRKPRAIFVAPSHQYPLGVTMSVTRRLQLLEHAHRTGSWIIEDDYDSEYRYDSNPIASLQGLDTHERVIYVGTFSKVMFPSLRLGYIVVPPDLLARFSAMRQAMDLGSSFAAQAVMAEFIREGHFSRHIRRMRPIYAQRRRVLVAEIERQMGDRVTILGDAAGMHLAILLDDSVDDRALARAASRHSIQVSALSDLCTAKTERSGLVLGFGNTKDAQIAPAVGVLARLLRSCPI